MELGLHGPRGSRGALENLLWIQQTANDEKVAKESCDHQLVKTSKESACVEARTQLRLVQQ